MGKGYASRGRCGEVRRLIPEGKGPGSETASLAGFQLVVARSGILECRQCRESSRIDRPPEYAGHRLHERVPLQTSPDRGDLLTGGLESEVAAILCRHSRAFLVRVWPDPLPQTVPLQQAAGRSLP